MKKLMVVMLALATVVAVQADLRTYNSTFTATPGLGGDVDGAGFGWAVSVDTLLLGEVDENTAATFGYVTGFGYTINDFLFTAQENDTAQLKLYNAPSSGAATAWILSAPVVLVDLTDPILPGANNVAFDFSGSSWEVVPEPATIGLMGIAGLGMFLARRKVRI